MKTLGCRTRCRTLVLACVVSQIVTTQPARTEPGAGNPPGLIFEKAHVSLGRVEASGNLEHSFPFHVEGNGPVQIVDVRPSCGCIQPRLPKRLYYPGESDEMVFVVHATSQQPGRRRFQVTLTVRQGSQLTTIPVILEMDLFKPIVVTPSNLLLYVNGSGELHQTVTIADARPRPLQVQEIRSSSRKIRARLVEQGEGEPEIQRVDLTIAGDFPIGRTEEALTIRTGDPRITELVVPVTVVRSSRIRVLPESLHGRLGSNSGPRASWQVLVSDSKGEPIRIKSVECREPSVKVQWPAERTTRCRLAVQVSPEAGTSPFEAEVVVRLAEPVETELSLPIRID